MRLLDTSQIPLFSNVQVSAQTIRAVAERGIPLFHHRYGEWLVAVTSGVYLKFSVRMVLEKRKRERRFLNFSR